MEERKKKEGFLLRIFRKLSSTSLSMKEYLFAICITMLQILSPFVYELVLEGTNRIWQIPITGLLIFLIFILQWKPENFIQTNLVEFIFFQIVTVAVTIVITSAVIFYFREQVLNLYDIQIPYFEGHIKGVILIAGVLLIMVAAFVLYDVLAGILLWAYVRKYCGEIQNPFLERLKAVRSMEDYEAYMKRKMWEEYERGAEAEHETYQKYNEKEAYEQTVQQNIYRPKPLFEHTMFFKEITDLDQVKPRYHMMMKIYHPDNPGGSLEKTLELQKEYQIIAKKYNL